MEKKQLGTVSGVLQIKPARLSVPCRMSCCTFMALTCIKRNSSLSEESQASVCVMDSHNSVKLIKFADDTTLIGLISNNDESAYRREVDRLVSWCSGNNLELNAQKTVEMIVDFRKSTVPPPPPSVMDSPITSVESFRFLGTTITQDLKWEPTISSLIKKAQQRMYFLRQLRKAKLPAQMLVQFYTAIIESILTSSVTVWFAGATVRDKQRLQRIVRSAEEVIGRSLPSLQDLLLSMHTVLEGRLETAGGLKENGEGAIQVFYVLSTAVPWEPPVAPGRTAQTRHIVTGNIYEPRAEPRVTCARAGERAGCTQPCDPPLDGCASADRFIVCGIWPVWEQVISSLEETDHPEWCMVPVLEA
uniref:Alkylated DNA repair protein AlkB homologue 8 N-terminal domain-containing protein n=1 Tax=Knipowitschia caucasica TaxID=637954 RepID=A0AAV2J857_KNICA